MQRTDADVCQHCADVWSKEFSSYQTQKAWEMKTAGVVIDAWKLSIFKKHLDAAKFIYTEHPGVTNDTLILKVEYEWVADIKPIIDAANLECSKKVRTK